VTAFATGAVRVFRASEISRFRAEQKYTVFAIHGTEHLIEESLNTLEDRLAPWGFFRVHRGELLQVASIRGLHRRGTRVEAELIDGQRVKVSRRRLPALRRLIRSSGVDGAPGPSA
jgi:DNA-binding LytR/AlgR family response regulator